MQINKIQGSNYKTQSFNGRIIHTLVLENLVRSAMLAPDEASTPITKMFQRIEKKLPQSTDGKFGERRQLVRKSSISESQTWSTRSPHEILTELLGKLFSLSSFFCKTW